MPLPDLTAKATLNVSDFRAGVQAIMGDLRALRDVSKSSGTIRLTAALSGTDKVKTDVERLTASTRKPIAIPVTLDTAGLSKTKGAVNDVDETLKRLSLTVRSTRNLWQTQILTDDQTAKSSARVRDELLRLAAAEGTTAEQILKATQAAAQAQRTLDASQGNITKGGFAFSASQGILDALQNLGGPLGSAASLLGKYVADGLDKGLKAGKPQIGKGAADIGDDVIQAIQGKLKIHSPSLVMIDVGKFITEGLVIGMKTNSGAVKNAAVDLVDGLPNAVTSSLKSTSALNVGGAFSGSFLDGFKTVLVDLPQIFKQVADETGQATTQLASDVATNVAPPFEGLSETFGKVGEKLKEVTPAAREAGAATADLGAATVAVGNGMETLAGFMAVAVAGVTLFAGALAIAVPKAAAFQAAIQNIATESDLSQAQLDQLGGNILKLAGDVGQSAQSLALAAYDVVGAGVAGAQSVDQLTKLTAISAKAATAGLTDTKTAVNVITGALNAYGLSAGNAQHVSDVLFKTTAVGKISFEQIAKSMGVLFPLANTLGVNIENLSAGVATLTQVGVPAEQAVTGLQNVFSNVLKPSSEAAKVAKELGIQFDAQGLKAQGLVPFLQNVTKATGGNVEQMGQLFGSTEAVNAVFALTSESGSKRLAASLGTLQNAAGATDDAFGKQAGTLQFAQQRFKEASDAFQIQFGLKFLPVLTKITAGLADFVQHIDKLGQNGAAQFALIVGGGTLAVGTILKLSRAIREAYQASALFAAVNNAGTLANFTKGLIGARLSMGAFTATTLGATIAAAPLLTVALGIGAAFAGWKLGEIIGELKLFGDETTSVNDKLTDFFAVTLFGANPEAIAQMRQEEEGQQRSTLAAEKKGAVLNDVTDAIDKQAEAERRASDVRAAADSKRSAQLQTLKDQKSALDDLGKSLGERALSVKLSGQSQLKQDLAKIGSDLDALRLKVKQAFSGDLDNPKLVAALRSLSVQQTAEEAATRSKYANLAVSAARESAVSARKAEIDAMREGAPKVAAQRALELDAMRADTRKLADQYRDFPAQRVKIEQDGQRQISAKRAGYAEQDRQAAVDAAARLATAYLGVRDAEATAAASASSAQVASLGLRTDRLVQAAKGDAVKIAQAQAEGARDVSAEQQRQADASYRASYQRLQDGAQVTLASDKLSAGERLAVEQTLSVNLRDLGSKYQTETLARVQAREQAERDSAERIRAARVSAVFAPVVSDQGKLSDLAADQALLKTSAAKLVNEREQQRLRSKTLADQDAAIRKARTLGITEAELKKATADRAALVRDVARGSQAVLDLESRMKGEVLATFEAVRALAKLQGTAGASGVSAAQRDVAAATREVGAAYVAAKPYLDAFSRSQTLSVADHVAARDAIAALTGALQAERSALDTLKGKWEEQKTAVAGVRDVITSLDDASGGGAAIQRRLDETVKAYGSARTLLVQGSGNNPAGLQKLATDFQGAYQKRSAAITAYYDNQAKSSEKAADALRAASKIQADLDAERLKRLGAQIDLRKVLDSLTGQPVGAERALADSTREVAAAYRETLPLLMAYAQNVEQTPGALATLQTASQRLMSALSEQQQKLEALRGEYSKQRDALGGLQGILGGFGKDLGDKSLLETALGFNQQTYERAKKALDDLLKSSTPDPVALQAAASGLKSAYDGLKGSLDDLGQGSKLKGLTADLPALLERTGAAAKTAGQNVDALGSKLSEAEQALVAQGQGIDAQTIQRAKAQLAPERELERQRAELQAGADGRAKASEDRIAALGVAAKSARDAGQAALDELNRSAQGVLGSLGTAAQAAQLTADQTGASLAAGEKAYSASLLRLGSLSDAFIGTLQRSMSAGGYQAGKALADSLADGYGRNLKTLPIPGAGSSGSFGAAGASTTLNFYLDGKGGAAIPQNIRALLYQLRDQATTEVRRGNL